METNENPVNDNGLKEPVKVDVSLTSERCKFTDDMSLWTFIRNATESINFENYSKYMDALLCNDNENESEEFTLSRNLPFPGVDRYNHLKVATELFLMNNCSVIEDTGFGDTNLESTDENNRYGSTCGITKSQIETMWSNYIVDVEGGSNQSNTNSDFGKTLPYLAIIRGKLRTSPITIEEEKFLQSCDGILQNKLTNPCMIELIWSYWHEEGLLVQAMNAISMRFQNKKVSAKSSALANLAIGTLRPMSNLLWGYVQDEQHRLTLGRRAYEYDQNYGLRMAGKAVPSMNSADRRTNFIAAFHNVLVICQAFYKQDDDTTILADAFPLLNAIKELHLVLSEGAHNQHGDLASTSRQEMLMQQWLLARPEMREFLSSRESVPYTEAWMGRVDAMKKLMGWSNSPTSAFSTLAITGEKLLLSIRYGNWNSVIDRTSAANWASYWRAEILSYVHAYRVVTGADLTKSPADTTMPSVYLKRREKVKRLA